MLLPKRTKYRKAHRGRMKGRASRGNKVVYGDYGLVALEPCWLKGNQIESARVVITRHMRRGGKVFIKVFPHKPVTKKPAEVRMGSGKGNVEFYVAVVKPGRILFEVSGVPEAVAKRALTMAGYKLPCRTRVVKRGEEEMV